MPTFKLYQELGVSRDASQSDIVRAYRKMAKVHHTDKGGEVEVMQKINNAYEILKDPEKRNAYNQFGDEGDQGAGSTAASAFQGMFGNLFGFGKGRSTRCPERQLHRLNISLECIFTGCTKTLRLKRSARCVPCEGKGGSWEKCSQCGGSGGEMVLMQVAPNICTQVHRECSTCSGKGGKVTLKCPHCQGAGSQKVTSEVKVVVSPGSEEGSLFTFKGMGDDTVDGRSRDLVVAIHSAPHKLVRHNEDLVLHQKVTLFEALTGISFDLPYLDGRTYRMKFPTRRLPCTPGAEVAKAGWGMPTGKGGRGVLLIIFEVVFPTEWTVNIQALMTQVWPMDQRGEGLSPNDTVEDLPSPQH